jgi:TATA-box binding protein (TBP) (component of TFIID and TFIIIB)
MVAQRGGNVVIDVTLRSAIDDEADQGYYQDESLSPEQLEALQNRLQQPRQATVITSATEMTI